MSTSEKVLDATNTTADMSTKEKVSASLATVGRAIKYCGSTHFLLLIVITMYIGLELAFFQTIFPTCVAATKVIHDSTRLIGLIACLIGVGEIVGSSASGLISKFESLKRGPIAASGLVLEFFAYFIILLMLPNESTMKNTENEPILRPNEGALCLAAFILGLGDAFLNSQIMNYIHAVSRY